MWINIIVEPRIGLVVFYYRSTPTEASLERYKPFLSFSPCLIDFCNSMVDPLGWIPYFICTSVVLGHVMLMRNPIRF